MLKSFIELPFSSFRSLVSVNLVKGIFLLLFVVVMFMFEFFIIIINVVSDMLAFGLNGWRCSLKYHFLKVVMAKSCYCITGSLQ